MQVDDTTVKRIARLARIHVEDSEVQHLKGELNGILAWVEMLNEVDVTGVEPMTRVVEMSLRQRTDLVTDGEKSAEIVANAPLTEDDFFVVPKVVE